MRFGGRWFWRVRCLYGLSYNWWDDRRWFFHRFLFRVFLSCLIHERLCRLRHTRLEYLRHVQRHVGAHRDQRPDRFKTRAKFLKAGELRRFQRGRAFVYGPVHAVQRAEHSEHRCSRLRSDAFRALDVVADIAHQREVVNHLSWVHAQLLPDLCRAEPIAIPRAVDLDAVADQGEQILVGAGDEDS